MPRNEDHIRQISVNKSLLNENVFNGNSKYCDWTITIMFYTAVHIIEKYLSNFDLHSADHGIRNRCMSKEKETKKILADYQMLENQSRNSRYNCKQFKEKDIVKLKASLDNISKALE